MDKKLCETANLCLEIMKSKRQVKGKLKSATQPFVVSLRKEEGCKTTLKTAVQTRDLGNLVT